MFSRPSLLIAAIVLAAVSVPSAQAYVPQSSSAFGGSAVLPAPSANSASAGPRKGDMSMKKGKPNVPVNMRSNYRKQQQMAGMRDQMIAASTAGEDGLPVFNLFVRTKKANVSLLPSLISINRFSSLELLCPSTHSSFLHLKHQYCKCPNQSFRCGTPAARSREMNGQRPLRPIIVTRG